LVILVRTMIPPGPRPGPEQVTLGQGELGDDARSLVVMVQGTIQLPRCYRGAAEGVDLRGRRFKVHDSGLKLRDGHLIISDHLCDSCGKYRISRTDQVPPQSINVDACVDEKTPRQGGACIHWTLRRRDCWRASRRPRVHGCMHGGALQRRTYRGSVATLQGTWFRVQIGWYLR